jgi:hypothetical protein
MVVENPGNDVHGGFGIGVGTIELNFGFYPFHNGIFIALIYSFLVCSCKNKE